MINSLQEVAEKPHSDEKSEIEAQRLQRILEQTSIAVAKTLVPSDQKIWRRDLNLVFCRIGPGDKQSRPPCFVHPDDYAAIEAGMRNASQCPNGKFDMVFRVVGSAGGVRLVRSVGRLTGDPSGHMTMIAALLDVADNQAKSQAAATEGQKCHIVGARLRAARGFLNWSVRELAQAANVSESTIRRMEDWQAADSVGPATRRAVRQSLERAGLRFVALGQQLALSANPAEP
jgi:hypothetical protein